MDDGAPVEEGQLLSTEAQLAHLVRGEVRLQPPPVTLSSVDSLHTKMKKMRQPRRRFMQPMVLRTNSVVERHSVSEWSPCTK